MAAIADELRRIRELMEQRTPIPPILIPPAPPVDPPYRIVWAESPTFPTLP